MAAKINTSRAGGFGVFINSPRSGKAFKVLIAALILLAALYGGYTVYKQNFSHAASAYEWQYNSAHITHGWPSGNVVNNPGQGLKGPVWYDQENAYTQENVWDGPGVNMPTNRQYIGCFYYRLVPIDTFQAAAELSVLNKGTVLNQYLAEYDPTPSFSAQRRQQTLSQSAGKFTRTCLAFWLPKASSSHIDLQVVMHYGRIYIKSTKITQVTPNAINLSNLTTLKQHDDSTVIEGFEFK